MDFGGGAPLNSDHPRSDKKQKCVDDHMDGHGEQPGPNPGGGAGRSEDLQGGGPEEGTEHTGVTFLSLLM